MDERLKDLYEAELKHLRSHAQEFAGDGRFRRLATRLGLNANAALRDPFVEWLLEGFAFLAARVSLRLEGEFPRFSQNLLSIVQPHLTAPTPSMIIAELAMKPDAGLLAEGAALPREARLTMTVRESGAEARRTRRVIFTTGRAARLWPIETTAARYLPDAASVAAAGASRPAPAAVAVTLALTPTDAALQGFGADRLDLFCADQEGVGALLFEATALAATGCEVAGGAAPLSVAPLGLDRRTPEGEEDALLPCGPRSFDGWRLLHERLALPARCHFLRVTGLRRALAGREGRSFTLLFLLARPVPELAGKLGRESLRANCVPAVNLFRRSADDLAVTPRRVEHPILPDRGDPTGNEVHSVLDVRGVTRDDAQVRFRPFFAADGFGARAEQGRRYYHVHRTPRERPARREERDPGLEAYVGADAWITLVDEAGRRVDPGLRTLSIDVLCTNRHLPVFGMIDMGAAQTLTSDLDGGWREIRVVAGPSAPRSGLPEGRRLWDALSALSLNHLALVDAAGETGGAAEALRQTMRLHAGERDAEAQRAIDALVGVDARSIVGRVPPAPGAADVATAPMAFARGLELSLTFADDAPGVGALAAALDRALAGQAHAGGFVQTVVRRPDGRERLRFPPRNGVRALL